ncbi:MAG: RDD family protein [Leeuwenhoekiella sp.]
MNLIVDTAVWLALTFTFSLILDLFIHTKNIDIINGGLIFCIFGSFISYYLIMEYKFQRTLGKFLTKTKVVTQTGSKPSLNDIFIRTLCRFIPFDRTSFIVVKNGFHDSLSKTTVVKETSN